MLDLVIYCYFYRWGVIVAKNPWAFIFMGIVISATCSIGLLNFTAENRPTKLWIPQDSGFVENSEWLQDNFPHDLRLQSFVLVDEDVLRPEILLWVGLPLLAYLYSNTPFLHILQCFSLMLF